MRLTKTKVGVLGAFCQHLVIFVQGRSGNCFDDNEEVEREKKLRLSAWQLAKVETEISLGEQGYFELVVTYLIYDLLEGL